MPNWNNISIAQYQAAYSVLHTEYDDILDMHIDLLSALTGATRESLLDLKRSEFMNIVKQYDFVKDTSTIKKQWPKWLQVRGKIFKPVSKIEKLTGGQYLDLTRFCKGGEEGIIQNLHNVLAVLCIPYKPFLNRYDGTAHPVIASFLRDNMTMAQAWPIALFFWNLWQGLTPAILESLQSEMRNMGIMMSQTPLMSNTVGS